MKQEFGIPKEVKEITHALLKAGFEAYLVGGCVRDLLMGRVPKDWDITTNAKPEEIQKIFPDSVYENSFGTVLVKLGPRTNADNRRGLTQTNMEIFPRKSASSPRESALNVVEITTFRLEGKYTDKRHPDEIKFAKTVEEDLARRDFTVNAMALALTNDQRPMTNDKKKSSVVSRKSELTDPFDGQVDLKNRLIRAVGDPNERFTEDALRILRALRFQAQLGFAIHEETEKAVKKHANLLEFISKERIRDELEKLIISPGAAEAMKEIQELGLLKYTLPELEEGVGVGQNKHHIYTVFEHNLKSFEYAVKQNFPLDVRIASLLHDVGKPRTKAGDGPDSTFYSHQVVGEKMVLKMLDRLHFPRELVEKVALLVREHMFVYDPETVTLAGVRRLVRRAGPENIDDLFKLREADRIGSGVPKAQPYRLRHLKAMVEKVQKDPISPKMLKIKGDAIMEILKIEPGPKVGKILAILLDEALENPEINQGDELKKRVEELGKLSELELEKLAKAAKERAQEAQERIDNEIKRKYFVK